MTAHPVLADLRVLVTRPADQASRLSLALAEEGASVIELPSVQIDPPLDWAAVDAAILRGAYDWVVFASVNGVRFFAERLRSAGQGAAWFRGTRVAAIGPETARALRALGVSPSLVPDEYVAEALVASMADSAPLAGRHVLLPQADIGRDTLASGLEAKGAIVDRVVAYRSVLPTPSRSVVEKLRRGEIDVVTFTSASTVKNLVAMLGSDAPTLKSCILACIGPVTAQTASELGFDPQITASSYTIPGLIDAVKGYYVARVETTGGTF